MNKVLSIDLDWILGDCISLYNDLVRGNVPILQLWEEIERERHCDKFLSYNKIYLEQLKKLVVKLKPKQVYWGNDHSSIILAIKDALDKKIISAPFILYNIDHHHDINYSPQQEEIIDRYDMANCGSWVSYLNKYELIDEYFWIKNKYSTDYHGQKQFSPKRQEIELKNQDTLNFLLNEDFDIIYITSSDCYIPPKFYGILEDFKKMVLYYYPNLIDYKNQTSHGTMVYTSNYFSNYKGVK